MFNMIMNKICKCCNIDCSIDDFAYSDKSKNSRRNICKKCTSLKNKEWREKNKSILKSKRDKYYHENIDKIRERDNKRNEKRKDKKSEYEKNNREKINLRSRERYKIDNNYRMKKILRSRFKKTMSGKKKYKSILTYLEISMEQFLHWIEYQFTDNMTWENQGSYWEIDHVMPCSYYNLNLKTDIEKCFHWKNMRPLSKEENTKKSNKFDESLIYNHQKIIDKYLSTYDFYKFE